MNKSRPRVSLTLIALLSVAFGSAGCNAEYSPTAPSPSAPPTPAPSPATSGHITGTIRYVSTGQFQSCLDGATAEIVSGPRAGTRYQQVCADWEGYGYWLENLPLEPVIVRASKAGYLPQDQTITPTPGNAYFASEQHFDFVLSLEMP